MLKNTAEDWFAQNMRTHRETAGLSQAALAKALAEAGHEGIHQTTVARMEKGDRVVRLSEAVTIADILGVTLDVMLAPARPEDHLRETYRSYVLDAQTIASLMIELDLSKHDVLSDLGELRAEVARLSPSDAERVDRIADAVDADLNLDMVGVWHQWMLVGSHWGKWLSAMRHPSRAGSPAPYVPADFDGMQGAHLLNGEPGRNQDGE